jgi:hypothetical protein
MSPAAKPGLFEEMQISGWKIGDSSFNYLSESYKTSFGLRDFAGLTNYPNLYFGFDIRKEITGPFVSNMLPLLVVSWWRFFCISPCEEIWPQGIFSTSSTSTLSPTP